MQNPAQKTYEEGKQIVGNKDPSFYDLEFVPTPKMLLSKDFSKRDIEMLSTAKFLPQNHFERVVFDSYSRSGNSLFRKYLQETSGIITGSDVPPEHPLSLVLVSGGLAGEGYVGDETWIVKSHFPELSGYKLHKCEKCIFLVRNPMDTILSYYHQCATMSHSASLADEVFSENPNVWDHHVRREVIYWKLHHEFWIDQA